MYLLVLAGAGDIEYKLVGPLTWDWIFSPSPGTYTEFMPAAVQAEIIPYLEPGETLNPEIGISEVAWDNDRALQTPAKVFHTVKELIQYVVSNNISIIEEWLGDIY